MASDHWYDERRQALELAKAIVRGDCTRFGDEMPLSLALVASEVKVAKLRGAMTDLLEGIEDALFYTDPSQETADRLSSLVRRTIDGTAAIIASQSTDET